MKKFINDNLWWIVIVAVALGGYAVYKLTKAEKNSEEVIPTTPAE